MKNIAIFLISIFSLIIVNSCKKDFLDLKPSAQFLESDVFTDPVLTETFVNSIYGAISNPVTGGDGVLKAEFVDEAHDMWYNFFEFNNCLITSDNLQNWFFEKWDGNYKNIKNCDLFFENVNKGVYDNTLVDGKPFKERLTGEVHFLRAFLYHQLVSLFGGVPIVKHTYSLNDSFSIARNSYSDCVDYIVAECDSAAASWTDRGAIRGVRDRLAGHV